MRSGQAEGEAEARIRRDLERAELRHTGLVRVMCAIAVIAAALVMSAVAVRFVRPASRPIATSGVAVVSLESEAPSADTPVARAAEPPGTPAQAPEPERPDPASIDQQAPVTRKAPEPESSRLTVDIGAYGYEPSVVYVKAGVPSVLTVGVGEGCAAGLRIPSLGVSADNSRESVSIELPALAPGEYAFSCGMEMIFGTLLVR